jgi:hypothetical protein
MSYRNRKRAKNNTRKRARGRPLRVIQSRLDPSYPPQNNTKPVTNRSMRYIANAGIANEDITARCLLNLVLASNTATTLAINVYEAVKINLISLYHVPSSTANFGAVTEELILNWRGERSPDVRISDRGTLSHPACIKSRPPKESLSSFWITNQSNLDNVLFNLTMPQFAIIDIALSLTIGDGTTRSVTLSAVGTDTGIVYAALNNAIAAGTVGAESLRPDSLTWANLVTP